jgi:hypothetical protein
VHPRTQALHEFTASIPARIEGLLSHLRNTPAAGPR